MDNRLEELQKIASDIVKQPLEGLLYDLDLLPEQCRNDTNNMKRIIVENLHKKIEQLTNENEEMVKCSELEEKHINEVIAEHGMEYEKEIEQLKKEREWLANKCALLRNFICGERMGEEFYKAEIITEMQQTLKKEE